MSPPPGADARALPLEALLLEQAGVAVVAMDRDGVITGWNHHAEELFGWTRDGAPARGADGSHVGAGRLVDAGGSRATDHPVRVREPPLGVRRPVGGRPRGRRAAVHRRLARRLAADLRLPPGHAGKRVPVRG